MNENIRELAAEYYEALKGVRELKEKARKRQEAGEADLAILKTMEEDLEWVLEYMLTGCMPEGRKRRRRTLKGLRQKGF